MRIALIASAVVVLLGGLFYWAFTPSPEPGFSAVSNPREVADPSPPEAKLNRVPSDGTKPPEKEAPDPEPSEPAESEGKPKQARAPKDQGPPPALEGLDTQPITLDEMRQQGVPERFKGGVVVSRVTPGSPAAEVALEPGDIIVRGQTQMVESLSDLQDIVEGREYTRVMFVREGQVMQVVLKPPFEPKQR
ncbi:MAG: PDZ domain-containing protein [Myxococcota bacterium]